MPEDWDCSDDAPERMNIIQSSFKSNTFDALDIRSQRNGFVQTVTKAYNDHHHLVIRCVFTDILTLEHANSNLNTGPMMFGSPS